MQSTEIEIYMHNEASISRIFMVTTNLTFSHSNISYNPSIYIYTLKMNISGSLIIQKKIRSKIVVSHSTI